MSSISHCCESIVWWIAGGISILQFVLVHGGIRFVFDNVRLTLRLAFRVLYKKPGGFMNKIHMFGLLQFRTYRLSVSRALPLHAAF